MTLLYEFVIVSRSVFARTDQKNTSNLLPLLHHCTIHWR